VKKAGAAVLVSYGKSFQEKYEQGLKTMHGRNTGRKRRRLRAHLRSLPRLRWSDGFTWLDGVHGCIR